jgi:hypothetical protein
VADEHRATVLVDGCSIPLQVRETPEEGVGEERRAGAAGVVERHRPGWVETAGHGRLVGDSDVPLVNGMAMSTGYTTTATGTDYWGASYNGDGNNNPVTSGTALDHG